MTTADTASTDTPLRVTLLAVGIALTVFACALLAPGLPADRTQIGR